jgi:linalool 8-monooxygenase
VARLEPRIRSRAIRLIDAIAPAGACDFVTEVAQPLTLGLLTDLLEVPEEDAALLVRWSNIFIGDDDPEYQPSLEVRQQSIREADAYSHALFDERRGSARGDFVTLLANAKVDGVDMAFETFSVNFCAFIIAANETTRHAISAAVLELSDNPAQRRLLIENPSLMPAAVKELIRLATPLMHVRRTATRDVELGDKHIRRGDKIVVWYNSANRDEGVWRDAAACDVSRFCRESERPMVAFGAGPHHCLGWRFAELQLRIVLEVLLSQLPDLQAAGHPQRLRSNFISGFKALPVAFTPR